MDHKNHIDIRKLSLMATLHCLLGCGMGEVLGMVIGTYLGFSNLGTIILAIALAFVFGYSFTLIPLLKQMSFRKATRLALVADTISITVMEIFDNLVIILIPGALHAYINEPLFWGSLAAGLFIAFWAAWPVNYYLIKRGKGHAVVHGHH